jgi:membrane associated rhomboid family serine protease
MSLRVFIWILGLLNAVLLMVFAYGPLPHEWGVTPRLMSSAWTLLTGSWFHANAEHLFGNLISINVLLFGVYFTWPRQALRLLLWSWILSSLILFLIGEPGSRHIGASTWVYSLGFYLMFQGLFYSHALYRRMAFAAVLWYGNMWQGMVPLLVPDNVSWEGHLSGAISGLLYLGVFRQSMRTQAIPSVTIDGLDGSEEEENPYDQL